jgi:membrane protease YdiL (CAAX protease family)
MLTDDNQRAQLEKYSEKQAAVIFTASNVFPIFVQIFIIIFLSVLAVFLGGIDAESSALNLLLTALTELSFLFVVYFVSKQKNVNIVKAVSANKKLNAIQILLLVGIAGCLLYAFTPVTILFSELLRLVGYATPPFPLGDFGDLGSYIAGVVIVCIFPAVCEEVVYRGVIVGAFKDGGNRRAILLSGVCFAAMHTNPDQTVYQFLLGCFYAYIFIETKSLWSTMIIHFLNNFIIVTVQFVWPSVVGAGESVAFLTELTSGLIMSAIFVPLLCLLLYGLVRVSRNVKLDEADERQRQRAGAGDLDDGSQNAASPSEAAASPSDTAPQNMSEQKSQVQVLREKKSVYRIFAIGLSYCAIMWVFQFFTYLS